MPWVTINGNHVLIGDDAENSNVPPAKRPVSFELSATQLDQIEARSRHIKALPPVAGAKGEQIHVTVSTNPFHGVLH